MGRLFSELKDGLGIQTSASPDETAVLETTPAEKPKPKQAKVSDGDKSKPSEDKPAPKTEVSKPTSATVEEPHRDKDGHIHGFTDEDIFGFIASPEGQGEFYALAAGLDYLDGEENEDDWLLAVVDAILIWRAERSARLASLKNAADKAKADADARVKELEKKLAAETKARTEAEAKAKQSATALQNLRNALSQAEAIS